jgi:hypothetical protein
MGSLPIVKLSSFFLISLQFAQLMTPLAIALSLAAFLLLGCSDLHTTKCTNPSTESPSSGEDGTRHDKMREACAGDNVSRWDSSTGNRDRRVDGLNPADAEAVSRRRRTASSPFLRSAKAESGSATKASMAGEAIAAVTISNSVAICYGLSYGNKDLSAQGGHLQQEREAERKHENMKTPVSFINL